MCVCVGIPGEDQLVSPTLCVQGLGHGGLHTGLDCVGERETERERQRERERGERGVREDVTCRP